MTFRSEFASRPGLAACVTDEASELRLGNAKSHACMHAWLQSSNTQLALTLTLPSLELLGVARPAFGKTFPSPFQLGTLVAPQTQFPA